MPSSTTSTPRPLAPTKSATSIAWFDEDLETQNLGPARGSGVVSWRDGRWLIEQYVLSVTIPNERFRAVRELLEGAVR
jgi:hypothetical protein